ncbi:MAG: tRNA (uridine(34)/cytosine(34)/5-carboxymethylaminomethyluridine(34)-2'-O)-methyltransferase TrmL [Phascolarctobacterium sp.]|nr:tRNA (uridine(34)/cytosine(34)/5-carboxymethylaminomethyluridine(34)-2'-O)-methyltransferase TrmL [Phascolarctobacterium sp.]
MHIVLFQPEIPGNTGNIARLCAATGIHLHLVRPLGFSVDDKYLKRAGLDYWNLVDIHYYDSIYEVLEKYKNNSKFFLTTKAHKSYADVKYDKDSLLIFGRETKGLPDEIHEKFAQDCVRIPMIEEARCLNLSNSAAIVAYEALRQVDNFAGFKL